MMGILDFLSKYGAVILSVFYLADKVVKLTPTDKDDMVVDLIFRPLLTALGLLPKEDNNEEKR